MKPDYSKFKEYKGKFYLHDACLVDQRVPHDARFAITSSEIPRNTLRYGPGSFRAVSKTKNYLHKVWRKSAKQWEALHD